MSNIEQFQARLRGIHAKNVQQIMARTIKLYKVRANSVKKATSPNGNIYPHTQRNDHQSRRKTDNISTYLKKFQIDRENLNLAKRILTCSSQYNHKNYQKQWKKNQNLIKVRSNFKPSICNAQPKLLPKIAGNGSHLVTLSISKFMPIYPHLHEQGSYELKVIVKNNAIIPTNCHFTAGQVNKYGQEMQFYLHKWQIKKGIQVRIGEVKEFDVYSRGKFDLLEGVQGEAQEQVNKERTIEIKNWYGRVIGFMVMTVRIENSKKSMIGRNLNSASCGKINLSKNNVGVETQNEQKYESYAQQNQQKSKNKQIEAQQQNESYKQCKKEQKSMKYERDRSPHCESVQNKENSEQMQISISIQNDI